jgi:hypothetical protein
VSSHSTTATDRRVGRSSGLSETLPISFALVGVQKAATSTIAFYLLRHRHVSRGERKERHFFDKDFLDWENPDYSAYTSPRRTPARRSPATTPRPTSSGPAPCSACTATTRT